MGMLRLVGLAVTAAILSGARSTPTDAGGKISGANGGVVVAGGFVYGGKIGHTISSVEEQGISIQLPDLPISVDSNTLTAVGNTLYMCGGSDGQNLYSCCYTLDVTDQFPMWNETVQLPTALFGHTAVAVDTHIWFASMNNIYDFDTETGHFDYFVPPFEVDWFHCAVSNLTHSFILGVGKNKTEVWVNAEKKSPSSWKEVGHLFHRRAYFGCLLLNNVEIIVTGGAGTEDSVELFDVNTFETKKAASMVEGREEHRMFMLDGKPAVVAGVSSEENKVLGSIETYDEQSGNWTTSSSELEQARTVFGLAQFSQKLNSLLGAA